MIRVLMTALMIPLLVACGGAPAPPGGIQSTITSAVTASSSTIQAVAPTVQAAATAGSSTVQDVVPTVQAAATAGSSTIQDVVPTAEAAATAAKVDTNAVATAVAPAVQAILPTAVAGIEKAASPSGTPAKVTSAQAQSSSPAPKVAGTAASVEPVLEALRSAGLPLGAAQVYTGETDPDKLLGRPGGYVAKANFRDSRLPVEKKETIDMVDGGSIEIYPSAEAAQARKESIARSGESTPALGEYGFVKGPVLLRLSERLTPDQASAYESALNSLPG